MRKYTVMIIYGGEGYERDISQRSAEFFEKIKTDERLLTIFVYISADGRWYLSNDGACRDTRVLSPLIVCRGGVVSGGRFFGVDIAIPIMHGDRGEDGYIASYLWHNKIRSVGSPYYTASLLRDKVAVKLFAGELSVPTADFAFFPEGEIPAREELLKIAERLGFPLFVKPRRLGSSIGASRADDIDELCLSVQKASLDFCGGILIERAVSVLLEAECAYLEGIGGGKYAVGAVMTGGSAYSYERKYLTPEKTEVRADYPRSGEERDRIIEYSRALVRALGIRSLCRVDFFVCSDGEILFNEINHIPGFTEDSLFPRLMFPRGAGLSDWVYGVAQAAASEPW